MTGGPYPSGTTLSNLYSKLDGVAYTNSTGGTDQLGTNVVLLGYDLFGRLTRQAFGWLSNTTFITVTTNGFTYNAAGDLRTLADGKSQTTSWGYDVYGHALVKTNAANATVWTNVFNAHGWLTAISEGALRD